MSLDPDPRGRSRYFDVKRYPSLDIAENRSSGVRIKTECLFAKNNRYHGIKIALNIFKTLRKIITQSNRKEMNVFLISCPILEFKGILSLNSLQQVGFVLVINQNIFVKVFRNNGCVNSQNLSTFEAYLK